MRVSTGIPSPYFHGVAGLLSQRISLADLIESFDEFCHALHVYI